jgi:hypothetical protein
MKKAALAPLASQFPNRTQQMSDKYNTIKKALNDQSGWGLIEEDLNLD